jgi:diguanylate cyclase (GGDEF)-like protein
LPAPATERRAKPRPPQFGWLLSLGFLNLSTLPIDYIAMSDRIDLALALRFGAVTPIVLAGLVLCLFDCSPRAQAIVSACGTVALAITAIVLGQFAPEPFATRYMMAAQFLIIGASLLATLPWRDTMIMTIAATAAFVVIVGSALRWPPAFANLDLVIFCVATSAVALSLRWRKDQQLAELLDMRRIDWTRAIELRKANHSLSVLSNTDPLTGVFNRRYLDGLIDRLAVSIAPNAGYGVLMIDVDRFKLFNDYGGHLEGDRCLRLIAGAIQRGLRSPDDIVIRYGGEEFSVILPDADLVETLAVAERLRLGVADLRIQHPGLPDGSLVSVSIGAYHAMVGESVTDALRLADTALYNAKQAGRDCVLA